jgi:hypothetical protein
LLLLSGRRQAGHRWRRLDRGVVRQQDHRFPERQVRVEPGGAPALSVALRLPHIGRAYFLHVPELLAFHPETDPGAAIRGDAGRLPPVVPNRPSLARLDQPEGIGAERKPWEERMAERIRPGVADSANAAATCLNRSGKFEPKEWSRLTAFTHCPSG